MLAAIKKAIVERDLSIAVPGKVGDMIAFTPEQVPKINDIVDVVNVSHTFNSIPKLESSKALRLTLAGYGL